MVSRRKSKSEGKFRKIRLRLVSVAAIESESSFCIRSPSSHVPFTVAHKVSASDIASNSFRPKPQIWLFNSCATFSNEFNFAAMLRTVDQTPAGLQHLLSCVVLYFHSLSWLSINTYSSLASLRYFVHSSLEVCYPASFFISQTATVNSSPPGFHRHFPSRNRLLPPVQYLFSTTKSVNFMQFKTHLAH